ncbi:IclR family transcriptional regulator [Paenarthrobacter sp. PH39-S1]|uniref:IclR family transcriptional regulator n=1 Tax=Paenarthrobacter sp. PH39-S1 TaxID=3046204 RepID=UPI0024BA1D3D|nr:IclR family transcriptional regulator [Paenarthrobacter sp. PH39-S1]MDJ0357106.1 IclR family transcriptional regulator [Paenarthrobacter sp. PH39-S1]
MTSIVPEGQSSFERGLAVMMCVAARGDVTIVDIAEEVGVPASTVYRYVKTLRGLSLIEEHHGSYIPGWRLLELSGQHLTHTRLAELGVTVLESIVEGTAETAVLTVRSGLNAICLRQVVSPHPLRYAFDINQLLPLHAGAGQRVLLAHAPDTVIAKVLGFGLKRITDKTLTRQPLIQQLSHIRQSGQAVSHGELNPGAVAISRPVFSGGEIICSLTVAGPETRCSSNAWAHQASQALRSAATQLSNAVELPRPGAA